MPPGHPNGQSRPRDTAYRPVRHIVAALTSTRGRVMRPTSQGRAAVMNDVARLAGVSHQTVSRVLNQHPSVSPATRERVLEAVRQLNYRPNAMARGLAGRRSRVIGVVS